MSQGPNVVAVAWSVSRSLITVRRPGPFGAGAAYHKGLEEPLRRLSDEGLAALELIESAVRSYLEGHRATDPDRLSRDHALATWINLYNAGALILAARARTIGESAVLGVPGAFRSPAISVAGRDYSLDDIEHAKLRRFEDPRIHAALVCGSMSCPTLRGEPYQGGDVDRQLDDQLRSFLAAGGCQVERTGGVVRLSRVFLWFGSDFVRPKRMPTFFPSSRTAILRAITPWLEPEIADWISSANPKVEFQPYDWALSCTVR